MSVNKVQGNFLTMEEFNKMSEAEQTRYNTASKAERKQMTIEFRATQTKEASAPIAGAEVEQTKAAPVDPEAQTRRAAAKAQREAEAAKAKEYAASLYQPEELDDFERAQMESVISDKPLYKDRQARRELRSNLESHTKEAMQQSQAYKDAIANAKTDKERQAIEELYSSLAEKGAKVRARDIARGDKIENTRVFDSQKDKRTARRELDDEASDLRLRVHTAKTRNADDSVVKTRMDANEDMTMHESALESSRDMSGDRYFEPNEYNDFSTEIDSDRSPVGSAKRELRRLGYGVKNDAWADLGKAVAVGVLSQAGSAALGIAVEAFAEAMVVSAGGEVLAYDSADSSGTYRDWRGIGIGAAVGTAAAAALFGKTQDEDVLHGRGVEDIFKNIEGTDIRYYEKASFGSKDETLRVRTVLRAIDELDLTDEEKTQFLRDAAGDKGQHILSKKELVQAFVNAYESLPKAIAEEPPVVKEEPPVVEEQPPVVEEEPPVVKEQPPVVKEEPPVVKEEPKHEPVKILVNNGDTMEKIAKRFGIDVEELINLNKDLSGLESGHIDCEKVKHKYLVAGKEIILPDNADAAKVKEYNEVYTADRIKNDYIKYVTSDKFLEKNRNCYKNIKAAGPEAEAAFQAKLQKEREEAEAELEKQKVEIAEIEDRLVNGRPLYDPTEDLARYKELTGKDFEPPRSNTGLTGWDIPKLF